MAALKFGVASYWVNSYWGGAVAATGGALASVRWRAFRRHALRDALWLGLGHCDFGEQPAVRRIFVLRADRRVVSVVAGRKTKARNFGASAVSRSHHCH